MNFVSMCDWFELSLCAFIYGRLLTRWTFQKCWEKKHKSRRTQTHFLDTVHERLTTVIIVEVKCFTISILVDSLKINDQNKNAQRTHALTYRIVLPFRHVQKQSTTLHWWALFILIRHQTNDRNDVFWSKTRWIFKLNIFCELLTRLSLTNFSPGRWK